MAPPSNKTFLSLPSSSKLSVTNLTGAGEDILDGREEVPEHMTHTFQRGDNIFVNGDDGSLWYAVIKDIRVQRLKRSHKAWVEVQWYYSRSDIGDKNMRKYIGNNELVLSDHNDIIEPEAIVSPADITSFSAERCFGPLIGPKDMYTRWTMSTHGKQVIQVWMNGMTPIFEKLLT
ncbi:hypothetical protein BKA82DRAFT_4370771 [Pisolithus tinctorius]|nr:hypothetical protein BKA82DRAFT_4370771 [Pisolithus tinctorius]